MKQIKKEEKRKEPRSFTTFMNKVVKHNIIRLYKLSQADLNDYIINSIKGFGKRLFTRYGHYIVSLPEDKAPFIVTHLDTKYNIIPTNISISTTGICKGYDEYGNNSILGADDRNGVWTALELYEQYHDKLGFIFSWNEETGCLGTKKLIGDITSHPNCMLNNLVLYFVQIDRMGTNEFAYYRSNKTQRCLINTDFEVNLSGLGEYILTAGRSTDIRYLCEHFSVSGINISAGYFNEHTADEYCDIKYLETLPEKVTNLIYHLGYKYYGISETDFNDNLLSKK